MKKEMQIIIGLTIIFAVLLAAISIILMLRDPLPAKPTDLLANIAAEPQTSDVDLGRTISPQLPLALNATNDPRDQSNPSGEGGCEYLAMFEDTQSDDLVPALTLANLLKAIDEKNASVLSSYRNTLQKQGNQALPFVESILKAGVPIAECFAMDILARIRTHEAIPLGLGHMLTNPGFGTEHWNKLARTLGGVLDGASVDLVARLSANASPEGRSRIIALLAHVRTEEALFSLLVAASEIDQDQLNHVTMQQLFEAGHRESVEILKDIMMTHDTPEIASLAAKGIARRGTPEESKFLAGIGNEDSGLAAIARDALANTTSSYSQNTLIDIANDASYSTSVREAAVRALGRSGNSGNITRALRNLVITSNDPHITLIAQDQLDQEQEQAQTTASVNTNFTNIETWF